MQKYIVYVLALLLALSLIIAPFTSEKSLAAPEPPENEADIDPQLLEAYQARVAEDGNQVLSFVIFDVRITQVDYSSDGRFSLLWLGMFDRETGEQVPTEPGLAIGQLTGDESTRTFWTVTLPVDETWKAQLDLVPESLLSPEVKQAFIERASGPKEINSTVYRGYKLPWAAGTAKRLSGSIGHFLIYNTCSEASCRYAYDFADGTMFPLLASRGGIVKFVRWNVPDRPNNACGSDGTTGNYLVLEDRSTSPTTYQLYLHMSEGTIPERLRTAGAIVQQGEYIGNVDNTGASCGHHLHFHVHTNPYSYWGNSVDIRFDDVSINDGTPRTCEEASRFPNYGTQCNAGGNWFVSGNMGANPPHGDLVLPGAGEEVTTPAILVGGTAWDDQQVTRIQVIARGLDGVWRDVGPAQTASPFTVEANLCTANIPNGPVDIALRVWDNHGNVTITPQGLRTILKNYTCGTAAPACTAGADKIVIFSEPGYQGQCKEFAHTGGAWEVLAPNLNTSGLPVGADNAASIRVGANVRAILFDETNYGGRNQTFEADDPNLGDNLIGANTASALKVQRKTQTSPWPIPDAVIQFPPNGASISSTTSLVVLMAANDSSVYPNTQFSLPGATRFKFELQQVNSSDVPIADAVIYDNQPHPWLSLGSMPAGRFRVRGRGFNNNGQDNNSGWSYFTVTSGTLPNNSTKSVPFNDALDSGTTSDWHATGLWQHTGAGGTWRYGSASSYAGSGSNAGSLTSPPVTIPASGTAYLSFQYYYKTETEGRIWDQRRLQISVDGGPFNDLPEWGQFYDDPREFWLDSPLIDLAAYRGKTIRMRFYFTTLDGFWNQGVGWEINNFLIGVNTAEAACSESIPNNDLGSATLINIGSTITGQTICPAGDVDYYKFVGLQGEPITARVDAMGLGSELDPYLFLLDSQGGLIAENDDQVAGEVRDSLIGATLPYTGTYYLKVKAWKHPAVGGENYFYTLRLLRDDSPPYVRFSFPAASWISAYSFAMSADVFDQGNGVSQVDFYYRSADVNTTTWVLLGSDTNGSDGWVITVDPAEHGGMVGGAVYVEARSSAGNIWGDLRLNLQVDSYKPTSQLSSLPATSGSTAVLLRWSAADGESGVDRVEVQYNTGSGWQTWGVQPPGSASSAWFLGQGGLTYQFRLRAVDRAGNAQDWPGAAQATTALVTACPANDSGEPGNNSLAGASALALQTYRNERLCPAGDQDWVRFQAEAGKQYYVAAGSLGGGAAVRLGVYDASGSLLAEQSPADLGKNTSLLWTAPANGTYYLRATALVDGLYGESARYQLWVGPPFWIYLPVAHH